MRAAKVFQTCLRIWKFKIYSFIRISMNIINFMLLNQVEKFMSIE